MESINLLTLIRQICSRDYSLSQLTEFINLSQKIAVSYLKYLELSGRNIKPRKYEGVNELEDVAIDCIAGLFMRNENNEFVQLNRYFGKIIYSDNPPSNAQLTSLLRRLIVKKTKQELSRIFKERDPEGAKIIRNIKVAIRNSDKFESFREMGREFVCFKPQREIFPKQQQTDNSKFNNADDINKTLPESKAYCDTIPEKILFNYFLERYIPSDSVSSMLQKMMDIVFCLPQYQNYIAIDLIATIIREVTFQHVHEKLSNNIDYLSPIVDIQKKEIYHVNQQTIIFIQQKINDQYLLKNKISTQKADIYYRAISDYVFELTQDKATDSNFQYLKRYIPDLTQKSYRDDERSVFEYLVKLTKKSLRKKLKELL